MPFRFQRPNPGSRKASIGVSVALVAFGAACNHSRYGVNYDTRLPQLKRIAVVPGAVDVVSLHSGGVHEPRPDLSEAAGKRASDNLLDVLAKRGVECKVVDEQLSFTEGDSSDLKQFALLFAVRDAIITHHYMFGSGRSIDYSTGDLAKLTTGGDSVDAVLWYFMTGVVPTKGRKALKTTAIIVGVLTGVHFFVNTDEAVLVLMLVDVRTGEVLWFNLERAKADVREGRDIRKLVKSASRYLLKPRD
nr:hypothetical protein [Nitrosomonas nitrosa]